MRIGSLCTGYGGLDSAVTEVLGGELAWVAENNPGASRILTHHFPSVSNHGDITAIDYSEVEPVDILTAGFPCQDVSLAGGRRGLKEGTRTGLWFEVVRAIRELCPPMIILENVDGLLSGKADSQVEPCSQCLGDGRNDLVLLRALGCVLGDLAILRYDARWRCVRACDVGAPHRRKRVFILATSNFDSPGLEGDTRKERSDGIAAQGDLLAAHSEHDGRSSAEKQGENRRAPGCQSAQGAREG